MYLANNVLREKTCSFRTFYNLKNFDISYYWWWSCWIRSSGLLQFNLKVCMISLPGVVASTPCNPYWRSWKRSSRKRARCPWWFYAKVADLSAIQYRTLNESKGYAVSQQEYKIDKDSISVNAEKAYRRELKEMF